MRLAAGRRLPDRHPAPVPPSARSRRSARHHRRRGDRLHRAVPGDQAQGRRQVLSRVPRTSRVRRFHFEVRDDATTRCSRRRRRSRPTTSGRASWSSRKRRRRTTPSTATRTVYNALPDGGSRQAGAVPRDRRRAPRRRGDGPDAGQLRSARTPTRSCGSTARTAPSSPPSTPSTRCRDDRTSAPRTAGPWHARTFASCRRRRSSTTCADASVAGNPYLLQTYIHNADLRWELFPSGAEVLAASGFYKYFENPIERTPSRATATTSTSETRTTRTRSASSWRRGSTAAAFGPGSSRSTSARTSPTSTLASKIRSRRSTARSVTTTRAAAGTVAVRRQRRDRIPQGRNAAVAALQRVRSAAIAEVGTTEPATSTSRRSTALDITLNQKLPRGLTLKVSGTNLLNQRVSFRQGHKDDDHGRRDLRLPARRGRACDLGMVLRRGKQVAKQGDTAMTTKTRNVLSATAFGAGAVGIGMLALGLAMTGPACSDSKVSTPGTAGTSGSRGGTTGSAGTGGSAGDGTGGDTAAPAATAGRGAGGATAGTGGGDRRHRRRDRRAAVERAARPAPRPRPSPSPAMITASTTWTSCNIYLLPSDTKVAVRAPAMLTIEPGTVIKAAGNSALVITQGAKIIADGTPSAPIVFTSNKAVGQRAPGDWGGLIIMGKAPQNTNANSTPPSATATFEAYGTADPDGSVRRHRSGRQQRLAQVRPHRVRRLRLHAEPRVEQPHAVRRRARHDDRLHPVPQGRGRLDRVLRRHRQRQAPRAHPERGRRLRHRQRLAGQGAVRRHPARHAAAAPTRRTATSRTTTRTRRRTRPFRARCRSSTT